MRRVVWKRIDCVSAVEFVLVLCRYTFNMANDCDDWWLTWKLQQSFPLFIYIFPSGIKLERKRVYIREIPLSQNCVCTLPGILYFGACLQNRFALQSSVTFGVVSEWPMAFISIESIVFSMRICTRTSESGDWWAILFHLWIRFPHLSARRSCINLRIKRQMFIRFSRSSPAHSKLESACVTAWRENSIWTSGRDSPYCMRQPMWFW